MKLAAVLLLGAAIFAASVPSRVTRANLAFVERSTDAKVVALDGKEQGYLLGTTRGVYLEGYGVVFTAEVDLLPSAAPNPFRPAYSKPEISQLKATKRLRIDMLKKRMRDTLISAAVPLDGVPLEERVALAVTIPYFSWEDGVDLPRQILMSAPRSVLLKGAKGNTLAVDGDLKVQEF